MRLKLLVIGASFIAAALFPVLAQENKSSSKKPTARGLFIRKSADAMRIDVRDANTGVLVSPNQTFKQHDAVKVVIQSNFEGYAYIINVERTAAGQERRLLLFPYAREVNNKITPDSPCELPRRGKIEFDETPGIEVLQVIMSREPVAFLDAALQSSNCSKDETPCELDKSAAILAAQLTGDGGSSPKQAKGGVVGKKAQPQQGADSLRSRDIILSPGRDKDKSAYVAIPGNGGSEGRLKSHEVMVFEIQLVHKGQ